jgi:hypothetical protein
MNNTLHHRNGENDAEEQHSQLGHQSNRAVAVNEDRAARDDRTHSIGA